MSTKKQSQKAQVETPQAQAQKPQIEQKQKVARKSWFPYTMLLAQAAVSAGVTLQQAQVFMKTLLSIATKKLSEGEVIVFAQFGSFRVRVCHAREMVNPHTGAKFNAPDRLRVRYSASSKVNALLDIAMTEGTLFEELEHNSNEINEITEEDA